MNFQESYAKRNQSNSKGVMLWSVLWAATLLIGTAAAKLFAPLTPVFIVALIIIHLFCTLMALKAHIVWLKQLDEFQKQVQLNSIALTLGITWIAIILLMLLSILDLTEIGIDHLAFISVLMAVVGAIATIVNLRKAS